MTFGRRLAQSAWLFAAPAVAAAILFVWLPMAATLGLSFFDWSLLRQEATWRGLDHYRGTLANPDFHLALVNTGLYLRMAGDSFAMSPPLIVEKSHIDRIVSILGDAIKRVA